MIKKSFINFKTYTEVICKGIELSAINFSTYLKIKKFTVSSVYDIDTSIRPSDIYDINLKHKLS